MKKKKNILSAIVLASLAIFGFSSCEKKSPAEKAGDAIEDAGDEIKDAVD